MNKIDQLGSVLLGDDQSNGSLPPLSRFLEQMWRRSGREHPGSTDPGERELFVFWYIRQFYERNGHQWPLPPALLRWLNAPAVDVSQEIQEAPGLRSNRPDSDPKYLSRYMQHVWKSEAKRFDVKEMEGFFDFLAWYAFRFMPEHHIPPVLLPNALVEQLNRPADEQSLPLTRGMLVFEKIERPDRFQRLLEARETRLYALCYEVARDVLLKGRNPRLVPAFVSEFWRSLPEADKTAFDYVTSLVEARNSDAVLPPVDLPLAHLFSKVVLDGEMVQEISPTRPRGLSIVCYRDHTTVCGLGKAGAYAIESLRATGIEAVDLDYNIGRKNLKQESVYNGRILNNSNRNIHVFNLNPEHVLDCIMCNRSRIRENDYFIGQFYWELSDVCAIHQPTLDLMDEIWVASEFLAGVYGHRVSVPVVNMGTVVSPIPCQKTYSRGDFGLRDSDYLFLLNFDAGSIVERKNPLAAVEAFEQAFPHGEEKAGLVIKTRNVTQIGPNADRRHWEQTVKRIGNDRRIKVIDATLPDDAMAGLYSITDCYLSLHRSEGFGYGPAEAMYWGKPTIVTAFSGVCDFCTESTAKLVDYELVAVKPKEYPYIDTEGSHFWAQPNVRTARGHMRMLYENPDSGVELGKQGQRLVRERYSERALSQRYVARLTELGFLV